MSTTDLAARMGVAQSTAAELEQRELQGTIQLDTLERVADALDCDVVYVLLPRRGLESQVWAQARRKALAQLKPINHSMRLEDVELDDAKVAEQVDERAAMLVDRRGLWDDSRQTTRTTRPRRTESS